MKLSEALDLLSPCTLVSVTEVITDEEGKEWEKPLIWPPVEIVRWERAHYEYGYSKKELDNRETASILCLYDTERGRPYLEVAIWENEEAQG